MPWPHPLGWPEEADGTGSLPRSGLALPLTWLSTTSRQGQRWWTADSENELAVGAELLPVQVG